MDSLLCYTFLMEKRVLKGVKAIIPGKSDYYDIVIENGIISDVRKSSSLSALTAIPGFIDTHIHGFAGCGTEDASEESILKMSENLIKYGITSFFPTKRYNSPKRANVSSGPYERGRPSVRPYRRVNSAKRV